MKNIGIDFSVLKDRIWGSFDMFRNDVTNLLGYELNHNAVWKERMPNYYYEEYRIRKNEPVNAYYYYETEGVINIDKSNMPESLEIFAGRCATARLSDY